MLNWWKGYPQGHGEKVQGVEDSVDGVVERSLIRGGGVQGANPPVNCCDYDNSEETLLVVRWHFINKLLLRVPYPKRASAPFHIYLCWVCVLAVLTQVYIWDLLFNAGSERLLERWGNYTLGSLSLLSKRRRLKYLTAETTSRTGVLVLGGPTHWPLSQLPPHNKLMRN